jgi:Flp pilus assembly protein TadG
VSNPPASSGVMRDETGMLTAFVAVLAVALLAVAGMAVDFGRAIAAQRLATDEAGQAARAGAGRLSVNALRDGRVSINDASAIEAAEQYMLICGHPGTAWVHDGVVTVRVVEVVPTTVLGIVGVSTITVSAMASAADVSGVAGQG